MQSELAANDEMSARVGKGFREGIYFEANMELTLRAADGTVKDQRYIHNTVTTAGKAGIADQILAAPSLVKMGWMALGTGTPTGTLLGTEVARVAFTSKTRSTNVITVQGDYAAGTATGAITEAGTFDVVTANTANMWMSATFAAINKGASDTLSIVWTLTIN